MAFFVSGAILGGSLISGGLGYFGANKAADTQAQSAQKALDFQKSTFDTNQANMRQAQSTLSPYLDIGKGATYTLGQLTGTGSGGGSQPDYSSFFKSPDYNFTQQQGELGINRQNAATGTQLSGGTLKDLSTFNQGLASQQYGNYFNRLMGLSQLGQNATNTNANLVTGNASNNTNAATGIGNTIQGIGQAQASGIVGGTNAITGAVNSGVNNSLLYNYMNRNPSGYGSNSGGGWAGPNSVNGNQLS